MYSVLEVPFIFEHSMKIYLFNNLFGKNIMKKLDTGEINMPNSPKTIDDALISEMQKRDI